jgi:glycosyltransferase involved in cell wall biosynthesis
MGDDNLFCSIDLPQDNVIEIGLGTAIYISGWIFHTKNRIKNLKIVLGSECSLSVNHNLPRPDVFKEIKYKNGLFSGFWGIIPVKKLDKEEVRELAIEVLLDNGLFLCKKVENIILRSLDLNIDFLIEKKELIGARIDSREKPFLGPNILICMATYNPDIGLLKKQIDSIRNQSYRNWICIINDDNSDLNIYNEIIDYVHNDDRFLIFRNPKNLGFYNNFERLLRMVPKQVDFVALSDQDDSWYPEKLEKCILKFDAETTLVYSDMKIVNRDGVCLSSTFWTTRKNYYRDLDYLVLANTVTGAASVFRCSLIDYLLPFPTKIGSGSFHDHWIACMANAVGEIKYIDEPLYEYVQHSNNVLGQAIFHKVGMISYLKTLISFININNLKNKIHFYQYVYNIDSVRLILISLCLALRNPSMNRNRRRSLNKFISLDRSAWGLLVMKLNTIISGKTTSNAEMRLFISYWANRIICTNFFQQLHLKKLPDDKLPTLSKHYTYESIRDKIAPLHLKISNEYPTNINIVIPSIDFRHFFAGYIGILNFAKKLVEHGYSTRFILVDQSDLDLEEAKKEIKKYSGLEDIFNLVSIIGVLDRSREISVSPNDTFIATTWWTAHISHEAVRELGADKFVYFIQEFEPFIFPMGTYHALADQSYTFPHYAIFSTKFLQDYFKINRLGVYSTGSEECGNNNSVFFENAIGKFNIDESTLTNRKVKKLLFYARPEDHTARNMFELGMIALQEAVNRGILKPGEWEFYGAGSTLPDKSYPLNDKISLRMLPKVSLNEYYELLMQFDLGLSLMYTPHPSLPPIEMAAAGLIVVTNTCLNKTEEELRKISKNIVGVCATLDCILAGLRYAASHVEDYDRRIEGSNVNWPNDWIDVFDESRIVKIKYFIDNSRCSQKPSLPCVESIVER